MKAEGTVFQTLTDAIRLSTGDSSIKDLHSRSKQIFEVMIS